MFALFDAFFALFDRSSDLTLLSFDLHSYCTCTVIAHAHVFLRHQQQSRMIVRSEHGVVFVTVALISSRLLEEELSPLVFHLFTIICVISVIASSSRVITLLLPIAGRRV